MKKSVGIVGASGYSGEVLVEILASHPEVELTTVASRTLAGTPVRNVFPRLKHRLGDLMFQSSDPHELASQKSLDVVFLALPHGVASEYALPLHKSGKVVIDLSADFRLQSPKIYKEYYQQDHPCPQLLSEARYVLPEWTEPGWKSHRMLACPGCYPTSILLPLLPLLGSGRFGADLIQAYSMSGVSGAGKKASEDFSFCERESSARAYGQPKHRHLSEIEEQLSQAASEEVRIQFLPHLIPVKRGILTTITLPACGNDADGVREIWRKAYSNRPFIHVMPSGELPETKHVVGTNRIDMAATHDTRTNRIILTTSEDNLLKGASGQAVQIMNLYLGLDEKTGLP